MWRRLVGERKKIMRRYNTQLIFNSVLFNQEQKGVKKATLPTIFSIFEIRLIGQGFEDDILM